MKHILVVGASGTVGSELVQILKNRGQNVLAATSKKETKEGQVHLNLLNQEGLDNAFENVEKVFLLSPPGHTNQDKLLIPLIDMAKKKGIKKVVLMTAIGVNANDAAPLRITEKHLEKSGLSYNIIRPNWFMQNFNSYWLQDINVNNKLQFPIGKAKGSFIDSRDISSVAAELLLNDKFNNKDFDLTGSESLNHDEVAAVLSEVTNRKIVYEDITPDQMLKNLLTMGLPKDYAEFMVLIMGFFREGYVAGINDNIKVITGKEPRTFKQYAIDYRSSWAK